MTKGTHSFHLDKHSVYWWMNWGVSWIPKPATDFIGDRIADWLFANKSRGVVEEQIKNLDRILGDSKTPAEKRFMVKKLWRRHGRFLLDMFRFEKMSDVQISSKVPEFKGLNHIHEAHAKGRGAIILTAHLGHWELGGILLRYLGFKINIVQQLYESEEQNRILDKHKKIRGINIISSGNPVTFAIGVNRALKDNELVAIQGDRDPANNGIEVEFFGKKARFPKGPVMLAMKTGAPLIPAFTIMGDDGRYHPVAEAPIELSATGDFEADIRANVEKTATVIERYVRLYPDQWFNFYHFWE